MNTQTTDDPEEEKKPLTLGWVIYEEVGIAVINARIPHKPINHLDFDYTDFFKNI